MSRPLATYLNDHLGAAQIALQLLAAMRDGHDEERFRRFAAALLPEIEEDDATLHRVVERIGSSSSAVKEAGGWLLEKATRLKLGHTGDAGFGIFESLELLLLGMHGKLCLWKALEAASERDDRLRAFDFQALMARAQEHYQRIERERIDLARHVFA